jgi:peptidylprolyl isomerase
MAQASQGDTVTVHYTGRLTDGTQFDSSQDREPLQFTIGQGQIIPGFEQGVIGMSAGEEKTVEISASDAYGPRDPSKVLEVNRQELPPDLKPEVGQRLELRQPDGRGFPVVVTAVTHLTITLDANHPLAGQDLIFEITLTEVA